MSKIMNSKSLRVAVAIGFYVVLVVIAAFAFSWMRQGSTEESTIRYVYVLCGPALSIFTHMSYGLFAVQSLFLVPWLVLGAMRPQMAKFSIFVFCVGWLVIGLVMHDVF